jgi:hypothetical protein
LLAYFVKKQKVLLRYSTLFDILFIGGSLFCIFIFWFFFILTITCVFDHNATLTFAFDLQAIRILHFRTIICAFLLFCTNFGEKFKNLGHSVLCLFGCGISLVKPCISIINVIFQFKKVFL